MCIDVTKMAPKMKVKTCFLCLEVMFWLGCFWAG